MKSNEIMQKLEAYKEKMVKLQMKLNQIEKKVQYKDIDRFGFYKPLIETGLEELDAILFSLEANIENIFSMAEGGSGFSELDELDVESMFQEQAEYSEKFIKPTVRGIEENLKNSVK